MTPLKIDRVGQSQNQSPRADVTRSLADHDPSLAAEDVKETDTITVENIGGATEEVVQETTIVAEEEVNVALEREAVTEAEVEEIEKGEEIPEETGPLIKIMRIWSKK